MKRRLILLGLVLIAGIAYGLTEEYKAACYDGSIG